MMTYTVASTTVRGKDDQLAVRDAGRALGYADGLSFKTHLFRTEKTRIANDVMVTATPTELLRGCESTSKDAVVEVRHDLREIRDQVRTPDTTSLAESTSEDADGTYLRRDGSMVAEGMQAIIALFNGEELRIVDDSPVTIVLKDVADALGYKDAYRLKRSIKDKYKGHHTVGTPGGEQKMLTVTRPGLSQLLATLRPQDDDKTEAVEAFQTWLYEDLLEDVYEDKIRQPEHQQPQGDGASIDGGRVVEMIEPIISEAIEQGIQRGLEQQQEQKALQDALTSVDDYRLEYADMVDQPQRLRRLVMTERDVSADETGQHHGQILKDAYRQVARDYGVDIISAKKEGGFSSYIDAAQDMHTRQTPTLLWVIDCLIYLRS